MADTFSDFIRSYSKTLKEVFSNKFSKDEFDIQRMLTPEELATIMEAAPLSVAIPTEYGGRGTQVKECLAVLSAASYESISLSLMFGINIALFLEPVAKYGQDAVKPSIFSNFLQRQNMGGLMITEPDFGSDALNMQSWNEKVPTGYHVCGTKHWQGLTGMANYWLITSRERLENQELARDIDFFICDTSAPNQQIKVTQYYRNLGLELIPYGNNAVDIIVPENQKLIPHTSGLKMMLDILHRSRLQFPGMAMGFIHRMLDEALAHCNRRIVGGKRLIELDQVRFQIAQIQSAFTVVSAMCFRSTSISSIAADLAGEGLEANTMKSYVTDLMQFSAQTYTQLSGANGYRMNHIGGRGIMDSRAFQIFEGSNEMLYTQIAELVLKQMKRQKQSNVYEFIKDFSLTSHIAGFYKHSIQFSVSSGLSQRKLIDLGRLFSRLISVGYVADMANQGFRQDLIDNSLQVIGTEISRFVSAFHAENAVQPVEDYGEKSNWFRL